MSYQKTRKENHGVVINITASYSGDPGSDFGFRRPSS
jgi:hypothetical protein